MDTHDIGFYSKGFNTHDMLNKLIEMVQAIQRGDDNIGCFGTSRIGICQEHTCMWRTECELVNEC